MSKTKKIVVIVIAVFVVLSIVLGVSSTVSECAKKNGDNTGESGPGTEDTKPVSGVWEETGSVRYSLVSDEDCPNGNVVDSKADMGMTLRTDKTYYFVADFTIKPKANNSGEDTLFTSVKISDDSALAVTEQELSSGKVESSVNGTGARTFKISYGIPESVKKPKSVRMVFKLVPKAVADVDLEMTFKSSGTEVEELPIVEKKLAVGYTSGLEMTKSGGNYQLKSVGTATAKDIIIPDTYDNLQVTEIADSAFRNNKSATSLTIPKTITKIGSSAFQSCENLTEINYNAETCESLGSYAFSNAGSAGSGIVLNVGKTVKKLPASFMNGVSKLYKVVFDADCGITKLDNSTFYKCTGLTDVTLPAGLITIGKTCFNGCTALKSIVLPDSVAVISDQAFDDCTALENINIPDGITEISYMCFSGCNALKSITIPQGIRTIGSYAFYHCKGLTEIKFNAKNCTELGSYIFSDGGSEGAGIKVTIGKSVSKLPAGLFSTAPKITEVAFEEDCAISSISDNAFNGCTALKTITLPDSVTTIGSSAFRSTGMTQVTLHDGVQSIGGSAFSNCSSLEEVNLPNNLTTLGDSAFYGCSVLSEIVIPEKVTSIGASALFNCAGLKTVTFNAINCPDFVSSNCVFNGTGTDLGGFDLVIGKNVTRIPNNFCNSTDKVKSVTFAEGSALKYIGGSAFSGNKLITSVALPQVTTIGSYAFRNCSALESIVLPASITTMGEYAFYGCSSLESANINSGAISDSMFSGCTLLSSVTVSRNVTSFGQYVFNGCQALQTIKFDGTKAQWDAVSKHSSWKNGCVVKSVTCQADNQTYNI